MKEPSTVSHRIPVSASSDNKDCVGSEDQTPGRTDVTLKKDNSISGVIVHTGNPGIKGAREAEARGVCV